MKTFDPQFAALATISAATEKAYGLRFFSSTASSPDQSTADSSSPQCVVAAPGRVNLIGEHIDYNDGFVLPMAIDRYTVLAGSVVEGSTCQIVAADLDQEHSIDLSNPVQPPTGEPDWFDYVRGVVAGMQKRCKVPAFNLVIKSAVPLGSGLSSSAALEVAVATFLQQLTGHSINQQETALLCQEAEHNFAKVPCGIMDQFSSVFGREDHLMLLDCKEQTIRQVPFAGDDTSVLIANTNVKHALTGGEYAERRSQCEEALSIIDKTSYRDVTESDLQQNQSKLSDVLFRRARHVVTEIDRTQKTANAIEEGNWSLAGKLMYASHQSLSDDFEVSCKELDVMVDSARRAGEDLATDSNPVIGSRMTGGGFGGCTVSLVTKDKAEDVAQLMTRSYQEATGIEPSIFVSRPSDGAHTIRLA